MLDQSSFCALLTHNHYPSETVIEDVRQRLHGAETEVQGIEVQIQALRQRADTLGSTNTQYRCILSPIRSVSDDVLREIFCRTLGLYMDGTDPFDIRVRQHDWPPLLFTHICHKWRRVAHSTPRLWAHISIRLPPIIVASSGRSFKTKLIDVNSVSVQCDFISQEADRIQQWLRRSAALPLSLEIYQNILFWDGQILPSPRLVLNPRFSSQLSWVFGIISTFLPRCERLTFRIPSGHSYQLFSAHITPTKVQNIRYFQPHIDLQICGGQPNLDELKTPLFTTLPALRALYIPKAMTLFTSYPNVSWPYTPDTWRCLTSLNVEGFLCSAQTAQIFAHCPGLIELNLHVYEEPLRRDLTIQSQSAIAKMPMHSLEYLTIEFKHRNRRTCGQRRLNASEPTTPVETYGVFAPNLRQLQYAASWRNSSVFYPINGSTIATPLDSTAGFPLGFILRSAENLTGLTISPKKVKETGFRLALQETGTHLTDLLVKDVEPSQLHRHTLQEFIDNGDEVESETDLAFRHLFPLPEWCKLSTFTAPVPLMNIIGLDTDELDRALQDQLCPRLENLELSTLYAIREDLLLAFITYRLRIYEYALHRWRERDDSEDLGLAFGPLTNLTATILEKTEHDFDITESVQNLSSVVGVKFTLKVDYLGCRADPLILA